jgi:transglutaminase-like putative cysteine protease
MSLDKALRFTALMLAAASFAGLTLASSLPGWLASVAGASLLLVFVHSFGGTRLDVVARHMNLSPAAWNSILVISFLGFCADVQWISGELLPAGIHFLAILMVVKVFTLHVRRDYIHLYVISLMAILGAASSTTDLWYVPVFLIYLLSSVWTLLLFQLTKAQEAGKAEPAAPVHLTPRLVSLAVGLGIAVLAMTVAIFFMIPRVSAGLLQGRSGESLRTSGFSDTVNLGAIGPIKRDPSVVMRVELDDPAPRRDRLYLRGVAYDRYDGTAWTNQFTHRRQLAETSARTFTVRQYPLGVTIRSGLTIRQRILLESLDTAVLFAAPFPETITGPFMTVQSDVAGALYLPFTSSSRIEYSVVSRIQRSVPQDSQPQAVAYAEPFARHYLQIPDQSERVADLARDIAHNRPTRYEQAAAIEAYLSQNYRYSLDVPTAAEAHPLNEFLFTRKTGYCEHYATAMVIMLRTIGIPARLVTGFLATEWNEYGNYFLVRQQDAHAWVEVHFPQSGWISMDPTPAVTEETAASRWQALARLTDHMRLRWNRLFIQYSGADQMAVVREVKASSVSMTARVWESLSAIAFVSLAVPFSNAIRWIAEESGRTSIQWAGIGLILASAMIWLVIKRPWVKRPGRSLSAQEQPITQLYRSMVHLFSRHGLLKPDTTPPLEFLSMIREAWKPAEKEATTITHLYCRARFGHASLTEAELQQARDSLRRLLALTRMPLVH